MARETVNSEIETRDGKGFDLAHPLIPLSLAASWAVALHSCYLSSPSLSSSQVIFSFCASKADHALSHDGGMATLDKLSIWLA